MSSATASAKAEIATQRSNPCPSGWGDLAAELARWRADRREPTMWWRDDDAAANTSALGRLLDLRAGLKVPLAIAVIPATADRSLAEALGYARDTLVLQHGWSHRNFGDRDRRKIELGGGRKRWEMATELARGRSRLLDLLEPLLLPVLVPPYNAIDPDLIGLLGNIGFRGLSTWGARRDRHPAPEITQANVHVDVIDWHGDRGFAGEGTVLGQAIAHLAARRTGGVDVGEPTGLNTHHLAMDEAAWRFVERFIAETAAAGVRWLPAHEVFDLPANPDAAARMAPRVLQDGCACNICGGTRYGLGPHARKAYVGEDVNPCCVRCGSLERHRAIRGIYDRIPREELSWRRALFFAPDPSLDASWFKTFETSEYGGENHIDMQRIPRDNGQYDLVALVQTIEMIPNDRTAFAELVRVSSERGLIQIVFLTDLSAPSSEHYRDPQPPHNWHHLYGSDVFKRFGIERHELKALKVYETDPVTGYLQLVCFLFRDPSDFASWRDRLTRQGLQVEELAG